MYNVCFSMFCQANDFSVEKATNYIVNDYFDKHEKRIEMKTYNDFQWKDVHHRMCFSIFCKANNFSVEEATNYIVNDYFDKYAKMFITGYSIHPDTFKLPFDEESVKEHITKIPDERMSELRNETIESILKCPNPSPRMLQTLEELKKLQESSSTSP